MEFGELKTGMTVKFKRTNTGLASRPKRTDENEGCSFSGIGLIMEIYKHHVLIQKKWRKYSISRADMICGCAHISHV